MPSVRYAVAAEVRGLVLDAGTPHEWVQPWDEFWRLLGRREADADVNGVRITLDHINGDFFDLVEGDAGFAQVLEKLSEFLPGLADDWYDRFLEMQRENPDAPAVLWTRA